MKKALKVTVTFPENYCDPSRSDTFAAYIDTIQMRLEGNAGEDDVYKAVHKLGLAKEYSEETLDGAAGKKVCDILDRAAEVLYRFAESGYRNTVLLNSARTKISNASAVVRESVEG